MTDDMAKTIEAAQKQLERKNEEDREREAKKKRYQELVAENKREEAERREKERKEREKDKEFQRHEKEAEARRKKAERADEALRRRVEQDEEREKAKEFREMTKRNEDRIRREKELTEKINAGKTTDDRIKSRRELEAYRRKQNEPASSGQRQQITPETIKASIKKAASKSAVTADTKVTDFFGGFAKGLATPMAPGTARSMYRGETKELSRAVRPTRKPITGGKVKPVPIVHSRNAIVVNPNYIDSLIGTAPAKKTKGAKDPMGNFLKRLF